MRFRIDPSFHFHFRCALLIALSAAFATLFGALLYNAGEVRRLSDAQRGFEAESQRLSYRVENQVEMLRETDRATIEELEARLKEVGVRQDESDVRTSLSNTKAPFDAAPAVAAIVQLVCIDNVDRDTYYTGSGTVIDPSGVIVTNRHILTSGDGSLIRHCGIGFTVDVHNTPVIAYVGSAIAVQEENDLALLKVVERIDDGALPDSFPSIALAGASAASTELNIGDPVFIGGYPGIGQGTFTFTQGVVSGRVGQELIKTSALIDSGASGGAVFDARGSYVGVPTAAVRGEIGGSLGYLVGANVVQEFLDAYAKNVSEKK